MTAEEPSLYLRCSAAGSTTTVIFARQIFLFLFIMNKSNKIRIRFKKYWILINWCKFKVEFRIFHKIKWSIIGHKSDNFYDIKKPISFLLDNPITRKCAKFQVDCMKIVWLMLPADLKNMSQPTFKKKKLQKKNFYTLGYESLWPNCIKKKNS